MVHLLDSLIQDIRFAFRMLRKAPFFSIVAILSLALGIGANTAIFSLLNAVLLESLPVREPQQLVVLDNGSWTNPIWEQIRNQQEALEGVTAFGTTRLNVAQGGEAQFVRGIFASGSFFDVLGVPAHVGRTFSLQDDQRGCGTGSPPAVLSYSFWRRHYGAKMEALGEMIRLDGQPFSIIELLTSACLV